MKYLKRYEKFMNENVKTVIKNIDKDLMIVEKQVLNDFSISFWDMSMRSSVFTEDEKVFIKENLLSIKVDLVNEGWLTDTLSDVWDKAKEVGGKVWDKVKNKITIIKNNIKNLCTGIADFVKEFFKSIGTSITAKIATLKAATSKDFPAKVKELLAKKPLDKEATTTEIGQLKSTCGHLTDAIKTGFMVASVDAVDDNVVKDAESQVGELENELKTESLNNDILSAFYIYEAEEVETEYKVGDLVEYNRADGKKDTKEIIRIDGDNFFFKSKEGEEFSKTKADIVGKSKSTGSKVWGGFAKWFLDMEQATPPVEGKAVWWIKLILKVITLVLSPIVKALEVAAKFISSNILKGVSVVSKYLKGPGVFDFLVLGGILAGIPALITEFTLVSHKMPEAWAHIFEVVGHFLAEASGFKVLLTVFGAICSAMTLYQLVVEFKHLFGHGHDEHGDDHPAVGTAVAPAGTPPVAPAV
jgi:hypothetical protein